MNEGIENLVSTVLWSELDSFYWDLGGIVESKSLFVDHEQRSEVIKEALLLFLLLLAWNHSETNKKCSQWDKKCSYKMLDKHEVHKGSLETKR